MQRESLHNARLSQGTLAYWLLLKRNNQWSINVQSDIWKIGKKITADTQLHKEMDKKAFMQQLQSCRDQFFSITGLSPWWCQQLKGHVTERTINALLPPYVTSSSSGTVPRRVRTNTHTCTQAPLLTCNLLERRVKWQRSLNRQCHTESLRRFELTIQRQFIQVSQLGT